MIQNVLRDIGGVGVYGVISICLFVLVFTGALIRIFLMSKSDLQATSCLPLEEDSTPSSNPFTKGKNRHD